MVKEMLLVPVAAGIGGVQEMQEAVDDKAVQFGLIRFELGSGHLRRHKIVFLHMNGLNCPAVSRGRANEYLADAKMFLDSGADGFHASVEVQEKADVTTENIISRVAKFFITDDEAHYSVKWLMSQYEQFILTFSNMRECTGPCVDDHPSSYVNFPGHESASLFRSGRDALKAVGGPVGSWNWVFVQADPNDLQLVAGGSGSIDEMRDCMEQNDKEVMFGLLRIGFGVGRLRRTKYVFVQAIGPGVPAFRRGRLGSARSMMESAFKPFAMISVALEITEPADFTVQQVIDRVRQAAVIDDDELDPDTTGKTLFSVEKFRAALQEEMMATSGGQFEEKHGKSKAGLGDKAADEIVQLVRLPDGIFNWALFELSKSVNKVRPVSQKVSHLTPIGPSASCMPHGGFSAARARANSVPSVPRAHGEQNPAIAANSQARRSVASTEPSASTSDEGIPSFNSRMRFFAAGEKSQSGAGKQIELLSEMEGMQVSARAKSPKTLMSPGAVLAKLQQEPGAPERLQPRPRVVCLTSPVFGCWRRGLLCLGGDTGET